MTMRTHLLTFCAGLLLAAGTALAAPLELIVFNLGEQGSTRNAGAPPGLVASLEIRGEVAVTPLRENQLDWRELSQRAGAPLVVVITRFGTRYEVLGLRLREGVVQQAVRRPAASTADMRRDRGQPGPNQLLDNAFTEIAADLAHLQSVDAPPPARSLAVIPWEDGEAAVGDQQLKPLAQYAIEAQALAAVAGAGSPVRLTTDAKAAELLISARPQAIRYDLQVTRPGSETVPFALPYRPQEHLYPLLAVACRTMLREPPVIRDVKVLNATGTAGPLLPRTEPQVQAAGQSVSLVQPGERPRDLWKTELSDRIGAIVEDGQRLVVFTDDGQMHLLARQDGAVRGTHSVGRRIRGAGGRPTQAEMWISDNDGTLLAIDLDSGAIRWELQLADTLVAAPARSGEHILVGTHARQLAVVDAQGSLVEERQLPAPVAAVTPTARGVAALDMRGNLLFWSSEAGGFGPLHELGVRPSGRMMVTDAMRFAKPQEADDPLSLDLTEPEPGLWIGTADGLVIAVPLPQ